MTMAASLAQASGLTYDQMRIKALLAGNSIKVALGSFITQVTSVVPADIANNRPVSNWLVPMSALQNTMRSLDMSLNDYNLAVDYVARFCVATNAQRRAGLMTLVQSNAILAAWNSAFGT